MENYSLLMEDVSKTFGADHTKVTALNNVSFSVKPGEFVSIIGPSGSGKSTFLTIAGSLQSPTSGKIYLGGAELGEMSQKKRSKLRLGKIGFILQGTNLVPFFSVKDQFKFIDKIEKRKFQKRKFEALLTSLDILSLADSMPRELSGGEKQRVAIAKALYNDPEIILADEPTAALDTQHAIDVVKLLAKEAHDKNKATIMVTHDPRMVEYSDTIYVLQDGQLTKQ